MIAILPVRHPLFSYPPIVLLGERACGLEICGKALEILEKSVNLGKVYITLERQR